MVGSCSSWCFEIQEISDEQFASNWEALLSTSGLKSRYYAFLKMGIGGNFLKGSGLHCLSKCLKTCVKSFVYFSDVLYLFQMWLIRMISGKKLINFLLVFTSIKLFRASAEPVQQSIRNSLGKLMYAEVIFQDMSVLKSFPKNLG